MKFTSIFLLSFFSLCFISLAMQAKDNTKEEEKKVITKSEEGVSEGEPTWLEPVENLLDGLRSVRDVVREDAKIFDAWEQEAILVTEEIVRLQERHDKTHTCVRDTVYHLNNEHKTLKAQHENQRIVYEL